jgi:hypothetical protein
MEIRNVSIAGIHLESRGLHFEALACLERLPGSAYAADSARSWFMRF